MLLRSKSTASLLVSLLAAGGELEADVIRLHNGGEIRGELAEAVPEEGVPLRIRTLAGSEIAIAPDEIDFVQRRSPLVEDYVSRSRAVERTVEAHWELAEWCRTRHLREQRSEQLERLLELDPDHEDARRILGHVRHNGQWMPREEMMASRGYVRYKGKWITQQELDLIEKNSLERKAEIVWYPRVRLWLGWVTGTNQLRRAEGMRQFEELSDPDAIPALTTAMADGEHAVRVLYVRILGRLEGFKPVKPLLERYLFDEDEQVREEALAGLKPSQFDAAFPHLVAALSHGTNAVVCRSASALALMGNEQAVPALIEALVTTHKYRIQVPANNAVSFATTPDGQTGMVDPRVFAGANLPPEIAVMARTGQLPYGAVVLPPNVPQRMQAITVKTELKNEEVLSALITLTGKNFGYNQRDWQLWWSVENG